MPAVPIRALAGEEVVGNADWRLSAERLREVAVERENENLELGYLMAKKQAQDELWWVEKPARLLTGNWELAVPNRRGLWSRSRLWKGGGGGGFLALASCIWNLASLKSWFRFPQLESGESYAGDKSGFSSFFLVAGSIRSSVSLAPLSHP